MRLIFLGSGEFAVPALNALALKHEIAAVYSQPPRRAGRGRSMRPTPVAAGADDLGLPVHCPELISDRSVLRQMEELKPDCGVLVAHGALLPVEVLSVPERGFFNIHPSLLPRWRGAAPVQRAIMAGDQVTGVCVIRMNEEFDCGPVLMRESTPILADDTCTSLSARLSELGADLICEALDNLDGLADQPQDKVGVTRAPKIERWEEEIDWGRAAPEVCWKIRGLARKPGAWTMWGRERLKVLAAEVAGKSGRPGEVLDASLTIACGAGSVRLLEVQRQGRRPAPAAEFLRGCPIGPGDKLGGPLPNG